MLSGLSRRVLGRLGRCCYMGMGMQRVHDSICRLPWRRWLSNRRSSAYGLFTGVYGIAWFLGSVTIRHALRRSFVALVTFSVLAELAAIPFILVVRARTGKLSALTPKRPKSSVPALEWWTEKAQPRGNDCRR